MNNYYYYVYNIVNLIPFYYLTPKEWEAVQVLGDFICFNSFPHGSQFKSIDETIRFLRKRKLIDKISI